MFVYSCDLIFYKSQKKDDKNTYQISKKILNLNRNSNLVPAEDSNPGSGSNFSLEI